MAKTITKNTKNYIGIPRIDFLMPDFSALVEQKGLDVVWERAVPCPCSSRQVNLSSCHNCQGTGWIFINPTQIKAIVSSINKDTKYKEWSQELLGTISLTVRPEIQLNFMDKITLLESHSLQCEVRLVKKRENGSYYINTIYPIESVIEVFKFISPSKPLQRIDVKDYVIENNFLIFKNDCVEENDSLTITYRHNIMYNVLDLPHEVRNSINLDSLSREKVVNLPVSAIARRAHNVIDANSINGAEVFDNSY